MPSITRLHTIQTLQCGENIFLESNTSHHLIKVLRAKQGLELILFNGDGYDYATTFIGADGKKAQVNITNKSEVTNESPLNITLLQGLSRGDRMDVTLQKSVELGVNTIIPILCERSNYSIKAERQIKKMQHWQQIVVSACEQSGRAVIPKLKEIENFSEFFGQVESTLTHHTKIILSPITNQGLKQLGTSTNNICIFIGPEGGLTDEEIDLAENHGFTNIQFGPRVLRTETAGPAIIAALQTLYGDI